MFKSTLIILLAALAAGQYLPNWGSLDTRPLPTWYDDAKFGIFLHWGVYSVPSFGSEWFWKNWKDGNAKYVDFMNKNYRPGFSYQDFASDFTAEFFDPNQWAELLQASGAKYVVLTSKHHEGYTLWPSKYSFSWNSMDVGPHRDLVGELADAVRANTTLKFGLYHSLYEWFNPLWMRDRDNNHTTTDFVRSKVWPEMIELVTKYRPEVFWSDGEWEAPDWYWNSTAFLAWLYNDSPVSSTVVSNDRWGQDILCKHGDFYTCTDRYNPGELQSHKWENCLTIDRKSWGFRREATFADFLSFEDIVREIMSTVSCGGNVLLNAGPTREGTITPVFEERLRQIGSWLKTNGEAIYASRPWTYQNETEQTGVWYTKRSTLVYASVLDWPANNILILNRPEPGENNQVFILGYDTPVKNYAKSNRMTIMLPDISRVNVTLPWILKFTNITN